MKNRPLPFALFAAGIIGVALYQRVAPHFLPPSMTTESITDFVVGFCVAIELGGAILLLRTAPLRARRCQNRK